MFKNLMAEMARNNMTRKDICKLAGCAQSTLRSKMTGETEFTLNEMKRIQSAMNGELTLDYLFERTVTQEQKGA